MREGGRGKILKVFECRAVEIVAHLVGNVELLTVWIKVCFQNFHLVNTRGKSLRAGWSGFRQQRPAPEWREDGKEVTAWEHRVVGGMRETEWGEG